jgi:O-antigen/teichoic acid export membrane protein
MNNVDGAINAVTFPVLSRFQNDYSILVQKLRRSLQVSIYFVWPAMIGLAVVSKPLITLLLTEKWLLSIPFVVLTSIICMFWPFSVFIHAINAVGKSGLALKLNLMSKVIELLFMAVSYRFGIFWFVGISIVSSIITTSITIIVASRILGFRVRDIIKDCIPTLLVSMGMGFCVYFISFIPIPIFVQLIMQIIIGMLFYVLVTWACKFKSFLFIQSYVRMKFIRGNA